LVLKVPLLMVGRLAVIVGPLVLEPLIINNGGV